MFKYLIVMSLFFGQAAYALNDQNEIKKEMNSYLDSMGQIYKAMYAPALWKKQFSNWTLEAELESAKDKVKSTENISIKKFQNIVRSFILSMKDYHVSVKFYATEKATLPFMVRGSEGRYFFVYIDREKLPEDAFPFKVGQELATFDGEKIQDVIAKLKAEFQENTSETDQALSEITLTSRSAASGDEVPKGVVTIGVLIDGTVREHQLNWEYSREQISETPIMPKGFEPINFDKFEMSSEIALDLMKDAKEDNNFSIGARRSFLPSLGKKIWESDEENHYDAYIYLNDKKELVGYVRIPKYGAGEKETKLFIEIIKKFQEQTDKLVIDQLNNPGGSVFYLYSLVSLLTDKPIPTPRHYIAMTQEEIMDSVETLESIDKVETIEDLRKLIGSDTLGGLPYSMASIPFMKDFYQFKIDEWNKGKTLTSPFHLGVDKINPHPEANYTKPILLLINELDFSGGDFFPAILQDSKRATIMGTRTAGAGGYVMNQTYPNRFGIKHFRVTGSLADRVDHTPIENLGVKPDIEYSITPDDYQNNFKGYVEKINEVIKSL